MRYLKINNESELAGGATESGRDSSSSIAVATEIAAQLACGCKVVGVEPFSKQEHVLYTCDIEDNNNTTGKICPKLFGKFIQSYYASHAGDVSFLKSEWHESIISLLIGGTAAAHKFLVEPYAMKSEASQGIFHSKFLETLKANWHLLADHEPVDFKKEPRDFVEKHQWRGGAPLDVSNRKTWLGLFWDQHRYKTLAPIGRRLITAGFFEKFPKTSPGEEYNSKDLIDSLAFLEGVVTEMSNIFHGKHDYQNKTDVQNPTGSSNSEIIAKVEAIIDKQKQAWQDEYRQSLGNPEALPQLEEIKIRSASNNDIEVELADKYQLTVDDQGQAVRV